jgi:aldehyde:ferredoxin oxidoreductase
MGSKKLKAVVFRGDLPIAIADPDKMKSLRKQYLPTFKEDFPTELGRYGTAVFYQEALHFGDAPVRNWAGSMEDLPDPKTVDEKAVLKYQLKRYACTDCPVGCGGHMQIDTGPYKTEQPLHKIEYETMAMFGCNLLNNDLESMIKINDLCNRYGMDTIGCGGLCSGVL